MPFKHVCHAHTAFAKSVLVRMCNPGGAAPPPPPLNLHAGTHRVSRSGRTTCPLRRCCTYGACGGCPSARCCAWRAWTPLCTCAWSPWVSVLKRSMWHCGHGAAQVWNHAGVHLHLHLRCSTSAACVYAPTGTSMQAHGVPLPPPCLLLSCCMYPRPAPEPAAGGVVLRRGAARQLHGAHVHACSCAPCLLLRVLKHSPSSEADHPEVKSLT